MRKTILEKKRDDGSTIYRLDRKKKSGQYFLNEGSPQSKHVAEIGLEGLDKFPTVLSWKGSGINQSGYYLLELIVSLLDSQPQVILSGTSPTDLKNQKGRSTVTLNVDDLKPLNRAIKGIKDHRTAEIRQKVNEFLYLRIPAMFQGKGIEQTSYVPGSLAEVLKEPDVLKKASKGDIEQLQEFIPLFLDNFELSLSKPESVKFITKGIEKSKKVYLETIIKDFEKKLKASTQESTWQRFLSSSILIFLRDYVNAIEKQSVDIDGKYPDFMLVDGYGYLDIYEIKKPQTKILRFDSSRKNYYWDNEIAKAIIQVEKYIDKATQHRLTVQEKIKRKYGIEVRILKPRGYVIAGKRSDLSKAEMEEDFRVLNEGLKNVDIVFYDDLLFNLKGVFNRIAGPDHAKKKGRKKATTTR